MRNPHRRASLGFSNNPRVTQVRKRPRVVWVKTKFRFGTSFCTRTNVEQVEKPVPLWNRLLRSFHKTWKTGVNRNGTD